MEKDYIAPVYLLDGFNCPTCNAFSHHKRSSKVMKDGYITINWVNVEYCEKCKDFSVWRDGKMISPAKVTAPIAHKDMPEEVKEIFNEARNIADLSPRAAAALLRVSLEKLTECLWETDWNLNTRIGNLRKQWLPEKVIKSLDIVRITANEWWSHAGSIDLTWEDNASIVNRLFALVNFIIEKTISENNEIDNIFDSLPEEKKKWVEVRDWTSK